MSRDVAIEIAVSGLLVGMLFWQPLRDVSAIALLVLLLSERTSSDGERTATLLSSEWTWTVGAFLAATLLAAFASEDPAACLARLRFYPLGLVLFLGARRTIAAGGATRVAGLVLAILVAFTLSELAQYLFGRTLLRGNAPMWGRFQGALVYPSDVSLLAILLPIASVALFGHGRSGAVAGTVLLALVAGAVSLSGTRVGFAALVIFGLAAGWIHGRAWLSAAILAIAIVVLVGTAGLAGGTVVRRTLSPSTYRMENRAPQWLAAIELFRESPILGQGPHGFRDIVWARHREPAFQGIHLQYAPYPHNIYLEALCGTGISGFAALVWLMSNGALALGHKARESALARATLTSLVGFAVVGFFDLSLAKDWVQVAFWLPLGIAAGLTSEPGGDAKSITSARADDDVAA